MGMVPFYEIGGIRGVFSDGLLGEDVLADG